jgi:hypothetical protein
VVANVAGKRILISKPDWPAITQTVWRLQEQDICLQAGTLNLANFSSVVYEVHKYNLETNTVDKEFGYAV